MRKEEALQNNRVVEAQYKQNKQPERLKSNCRVIVIGLIISLSALMYGYSLKEITSVPIKTMVKQYNITINQFVAQSILIGILPLGSVLGCILTKILIHRQKRRTGIYVFTIINVIGIALVNITNFPVFIVGRFVEGISIGFYSAIGPVYLREIAPKEKRSMLGLFFNFGKVSGVLFAIFLQIAFRSANVEIGWRIILSLTGVFAILQAILMCFLGSDTPTQMFQKNDLAEARRIIEDLYKPQYAEQLFDEYQREYEIEIARGRQVSETEIVKELEEEHKIKTLSKISKDHEEHIRQQMEEQINKQKHILEKSSIQLVFPHSQQQRPASQNQNTPPRLREDDHGLTYEQKRNLAFCLGAHMCGIRNLTGGNTMISQGGLFIKTFDDTLGDYTSLIINMLQFIFVTIGLLYIQKKAGRRPLFLVSIAFMCANNFALAIAMIHRNLTATMTLMCTYMIVYGATFSSLIWAYPSQIIPASQALIPNIVQWVTISFATLVPPLVSGAMPDNNPYPVFIFFGLYGIISFIHVFRYLRESKGKTYDEIIKSFH